MNTARLVCPDCHSGESISITATASVTVFLTENGDRLGIPNDPEYDCRSMAHCDECGWDGIVAELIQEHLLKFEIYDAEY